MIIGINLFELLLMIKTFKNHHFIDKGLINGMINKSIINLV